MLDYASGLYDVMLSREAPKTNEIDKLLGGVDGTAASTSTPTAVVTRPLQAGAARIRT